MKLYFSKSTGDRQFLGDCDNYDIVNQKMSEFLKSNNISSPYMRGWQEDNIITYDFGSWSEFFKLEL